MFNNDVVTLSDADAKKQRLQQLQMELYEKQEAADLLTIQWGLWGVAKGMSSDDLHTSLLSLQEAEKWIEKKAGATSCRKLSYM